MTANDLRNRRAPLEMSPEAFREAGHRLVDEIAAFLESLPGRPVTRDETPSALRTFFLRSRTRERPPGDLLAETAPSPLRPFALQRAPEVPRLHHLLGRSDRGFGRSAGGRGQPQRGRVAALADRLRDRGPVHPVDGQPPWPARRERGAPRERGQHGELRLLPRRTAGESGRGRPPVGSAPRRTAAPRLRLDRDPHLASENSRPLRPRHGQPALDPGAGRPHHRHRPSSAGSRRTAARGTSRSCSSGTRAR